MTYTDIIYDRDETGIVTITINRPDKLNAFSAHTVDELIDAFTQAWKDRGCGVVILTGVGRAFRSGADMAEFRTHIQAGPAEAIARFMRPGQQLARRVESANAYVANDHPDCLHDCIFLICDNCGQTTHIDDDALSNGVRAAARLAGTRSCPGTPT